MQWFSFDCFDFLNEIFKSKAECEERERVLKVSEEVKTCEHPSQRLEEWVS